MNLVENNLVKIKNLIFRLNFFKKKSKRTGILIEDSSQITIDGFKSKGLDTVIDAKRVSDLSMKDIESK